MTGDFDGGTESGVDLTRALSADERTALFAALEADDHQGALQLLATAEARTGHVNNPEGNEPALKAYWLTGEGGRRIRWRTKGAFTRCVAEVEATEARNHLTDIKGFCAQLYHDANGRWPGPLGAKKANKKEGGLVTALDERATEAADSFDGRVLEARAAAADGGRVFRVEVIRAGRSRNGRDYPLGVLEAAAPLYEGAQVYDGHRDDGALRSSAVAGLVGYLSGVTATSAGLEADLHLLPSAARVAEALDVALGLAAGGRATPFVGLSHDVMATFRPGPDGTQEATTITAVNSVDVVAVPAAGGRPVRAVAGGTDAPVVEFHDRTTARGQALIASETAARRLPAVVADHVAASLPQQFTEADLTARLDLALDARAAAEAIPDGVGPVGGTQVTDERDRKVAALDAFWDTSPGRSAVAYRSLTEAYLDIERPKLDFLSGGDVSRRVLGAGGYDSARSTESLLSTSWAQVLGDSVARRVVAEYGAVPQYADWRQLCSSMATGVDFRTQRRTRFGGYGLLPSVSEAQPYAPLTSPGDEEATYAAVKRGGTEDLTWEMIRNDDMDAVRRIPRRLGRSAAITLYRFVFDFFASNITCTYDSTALFDAGHANTDTSSALSSGTLDVGRRKMRSQSAYGDAVDLLSLVPRFLLVPNELELIAWQISTSLVVVPSGGSAGPTDIPNLHRGLTPVVVDYWTDDNDWFLVADPAQAPTFELGFVGPTDQPELFTQSDPNQGSMFDADILTYKIRHVYGGTWIDHRSAYRGQG
ncbi:hypothetical protein [Pseudofrankia sp. BMG5.37]|uniref:phage major capsid protein n=1 Tax=Pseudofrankia sp. BMG5.37 TaxID=3050035 RepID=UPI002894A143|nr:hypothetical protein [Pseudofrankia sp. BMG5.37]MDT3441303.1 hypothetical protein [Pseudofrankia sp. BMG5.37]